VGHVGYLKIKKILFVKPPYALALRAGPPLPPQIKMNITESLQP